MMKWVKVGILMVAFCLAGNSAQALSLGTAGNYNVFVYGNYVGSNSDVQGRLAAGGNVTLKNYGVGEKLPTNSGNVLISGGNLTYTNGQINNGNAVTGGNATLTGVGVPNGDVTEGTRLPVDFSAEWNYLASLSSGLSQMSATGTISSPWSGALLFQGDNTSSLQVFDISGSDLSSANTFGFLNDTTMVSDDATLIFNISGTSVEMGNFDMAAFMNLLGESWDNVLFNFYEAETLNIYNIGIYGSILAPLADITAGYGQINGTIIANSWTGTMQVNDRPFDGNTPPAPVPEPATILLLGSGLLGLMGTARKKRG